MGFFASIQNIFSVYILIAVGYVLTKKNILSSEFGGRMAWIVMNLTFPAYILTALPERFSSDLLLESLGGIGISVIATIVLYPIGYAAAKLIKISKERMGTFLALFVYSNIVFIGIPVNQALFGDGAVSYVLEYYIATTLMFWTLAVYFLQKSSSGGKGRIGLKALLTPSLIATMAAILLVLFEVKLPNMLQKPASMLGNMNTPLAILFIGMVFAEMKLSDFKITKDFWAIMSGRFLFAPAAMLLTVFLFTDFGAERGEVYILQAAMPAMNQVTILTQYYGGDYKYSAMLTMWSFIVSMVTLPLTVSLFGYIY